MSRLRQGYDFVVLDAPPVMHATSGAYWTRLADGVVLVVEADRVRWEVAQEAKELLDRSHAHVLGVVLNKRRYPVPAWLYQAV